MSCTGGYFVELNEDIFPPKRVNTRYFLLPVLGLRHIFPSPLLLVICIVGDTCQFIDWYSLFHVHWQFLKKSSHILSYITSMKLSLSSRKLSPLSVFHSTQNHHCGTVKDLIFYPIEKTMLT